MSRRLEDMRPGGPLCDMHYGFGQDYKHLRAELRNKILCIESIVFPAKSGCKFIDAQEGSPRYTNKMLVLIAEPTYEAGNLRAIFAYSYDDRLFGVVAITVEPAPA